MRKLPQFEYLKPGTVEDVLLLLTQFRDDVRPLAGGTDLLIQMKHGLVSPSHIMALKGISELAEIDEVKGGGLKIGALATHTQLLESPIIKLRSPILIDALTQLGSHQVRNAATIGGNICNASPAADTAPALLVLEAECILVSPRGERRIALESFFIGPGLTVLEKDEIIKEIIVPETPPSSIGAYLKLGRRKTMDLAIVSVAVLLTLNPNTRICERARVALGSVSPTPVRAFETEKCLEGETINEVLIRKAGETVQRECSPISDIRASAYYRKELVKVLLEKAIKRNLSISIPTARI